MLLNIKPLPAIDREDGEMYGSPIPKECEIPSEFLEQYLHRFLMMCLEELAVCNTPASKIKERLDGVRYFVGCYGGIHSRLAVNNVFRDVCDLSDEELKRRARETFKDLIPN